MKERLTLLIIEDEAIVRKSIRTFFEDSGFEVLGAGEAASGLWLFREKRPDVVLVALKMAGISGLEVIDALAGRRQRRPWWFFQVPASSPMPWRLSGGERGIL